MRRGLWFAAGAASGVYALAKARRTAEALTSAGLRDRLAGLSLGARLFTEEVRAEMTEREIELRARLKLELADARGAIAPPASDNSAETKTRSS